VWPLARDLLVAIMLLGGYAWLSALTLRQRRLSRRLALHICSEPVPIRPAPRPPGSGSAAGGRRGSDDAVRRDRAADRPRPNDRAVTVAELLAREARRESRSDRGADG